MRNPADHMHYYVFSKGRYKRKLIDEETLTLLLLVGATIANNPTYSTNGVYASLASIPKDTAWYRAVSNKVHFPYCVLAKKSIPVNFKVRALRHNQCPKCPLLGS